MLAGFAPGRFIRRPMRPAICKCPNHAGCLLAYHGDDIEVQPDMPLVCPECGTGLVFPAKPRSDFFFRIVNLIVFAAAATALWFAWPTLVQLWEKVTTPPPKSTPAKH